MVLITGCDSSSVTPDTTHEVLDSERNALFVPLSPDSLTVEEQNEGVLEPYFIQDLENAAGGEINLDYFSVTVPGNQIPNGWTADAYLEHIRTNLNDYVDTTISQFEAYPGLDSWTRWLSTTPLGTVFSIQLTPEILGIQFDLEDGSVVASGDDQASWIFTTLYTSEDGYHPVSGNRRFGFSDNGDGTYTFYTRGTDRLSTDYYDWGNWLMGGFAFNSADDLWQSFQDQIAGDFGAAATVHAPVTYRPDYEQVADVLNGTADVSALEGCN